MIDFDLKTKYTIDRTSEFKKQFKKVVKQGKNINKFLEVLEKLANGKVLENSYRDHGLINDKYYKNCRNVILIRTYCLYINIKTQNLYYY